MADTPETVMFFLQSLADKALPAARKQYAELESFAQQQGAQLPLKAWDIAYWSERFRQAELKLSDEELKPFFPLERMLDALFHTAGQLFGLSMVPDQSIATWHEDVRFFWLQDDCWTTVRRFIHGPVCAQRQAGWGMDGCMPVTTANEGNHATAHGLPDLQLCSAGR